MLQVCAELQRIGPTCLDLRLPSAGLLATKCKSEEVLCMARCLPVALLAAPELAPLITLLLGGPSFVCLGLWCNGTPCKVLVR